MGVSTFPGMNFDLSVLIPTNADLESLVDPFFTVEMDDLVKRIPIDKAPGLDGFNGFFFLSKVVGLLFPRISTDLLHNFMLSWLIFNVLILLTSLWSQRRLILNV